MNTSCPTTIDGSKLDWPDIIHVWNGAAIFVLPILLMSIVTLRREHPQAVNVMWYIFSFTFIFVSIFLIFYLSLQKDNYLYGISSFVYELIYTSANIFDELGIIAAFLSLAILPQILSYILSGLFGCATTPIFVSTVFKLAILSLAKFCCVLSGNAVAMALFLPEFHIPDECITPVAQKLSFLLILILPFTMMSIGFLLLALYYNLDHIYMLLPNRWFVPLHRFMTRHDRNIA